MTRTFLLGALAALAMTSAASAATTITYESAANVITPSPLEYFEDGAYARYVGEVPLDAILTTTGAHSGDHSWEPSGGGRGSTEYGFVGGALFTNFHVWALSALASPTTLELYGYDAGGNVVESLTSSLSGTWGEFSLACTSGCAYVRGRGTLGIAPDYDVSRFDDVSFDRLDAVPELGTWAMLILGFAGAGMMLRRRHAFA